MGELLAGFVVGYALALAIPPAAAIAIVRTNARSGFAQRIAPPGTNVVALSMVLHLVAVLILTAIGLILGMALAGVEERHPEDGLGSPNLVYTLIVIALTAVMLIPTLARPRLVRYAAPAAVVFAVLFGWAVPWLAAAA